MFRFSQLLAIALVIGVVEQSQANFLFDSRLTGSQEVPPNASTATGFATLTLNAAQTQLTYSVTINGIDITGSQTGSTTDNLTAAHIHRAAAGANGPVVFGFFGMPFNDNAPNDVVITPFGVGVGGTISGKWDLNEGNGSNTLANQLTHLFAGSLYFNFHTSGIPSGEIRGQILVATPAPATVVLIGLGMVTLFGSRKIRK